MTLDDALKRDQIKRTILTTGVELKSGWREFVGGEKTLIENGRPYTFYFQDGW